MSVERVVTKTIGDQAEEKAGQYLVSQGCQIISKNYHSKAGEIDLILIDQGTLVFVEVRYRSDTSRGTGAETIPAAKRRKIIKTAEFFLMKHKKYQILPCRFDVISMNESVDWIKRAFTLDS